MKIIDIVLIAFFLFAELSNAQTGFRSGYIIKNEGDTLFGQVDFKSEVKMSKVCLFKQQDSLQARTYLPFEISGYRFTDGKYYVSKKVNNKNVFLEFLIKGKVNMYFLADDEADHYFIEKDTMFTEIPYHEEIKMQYNNKLLIRSKKHLGILSYYMQDAPKINPEIQKILQPDRKNLIALAKDYHRTICNDEACIVYENKPPVLKVNLECLIGSMNLKSDKSYITTGVLTHIWLPSFSEDCFFRTGLIYATSVIAIPVQLEYVLPSEIIQPKAALGVNLVTNDFSLMLGINIKLAKKAFLSFNYDRFHDIDLFSVGFNLTL